MEVEEWLADRFDPSPLLEYFETSERKLRLFVVACCRRVQDHLPGDGSRRAIDVAERYSDGRANAEQLASARAEVEPYASLSHPGDHNPVRWVSDFKFSADMCALDAALLVADRTLAGSDSASQGEWEEADNAESLAQVQLFREIVGNPFRPITFSPDWRTSDVMHLANGIYDDKAFDRMPILADALQDAGCDCDDILNHLRDTSVTHVRGCWAIDLVLGK